MSNVNNILYNNYLLEIICDYSIKTFNDIINVKHISKQFYQIINVNEHLYKILLNIHKLKQITMLHKSNRLQITINIPFFSKYDNICIPLINNEIYLVRWFNTNFLHNTINIITNDFINLYLLYSKILVYFKVNSYIFDVTISNNTEQIIRLLHKFICILFAEHNKTNVTLILHINNNLIEDVINASYSNNIKFTKNIKQIYNQIYIVTLQK